jgi:NAD kinase
MERLTENKIILVTRPTRLAELIARFNTAGQAQFYVEHLGADFSDYQREDEQYRRALAEARAALETLGRVQLLDRSFLPNFVFAPADTVVVLGQDGLVANTVKYLERQPVIGVNPDPERWDGQLLPFAVRDLDNVLREVFAGTRPTRNVTMARATFNNGQTLRAVNDIFIGPRTHSSARYHIAIGKRGENHSSSGVIVSTGLGSSGWLKSLLTGATGIAMSAGTTGEKSRASRELRSGFRVKSEFPWDADYLYFTVREPFPTRTTDASLLFGKVTVDEPLTLTSLMPEHGVIFSDGIEKDFLEFNSGTRVTIDLAEGKGVLVQ